MSNSEGKCTIPLDPQVVATLRGMDFLAQNIDPDPEVARLAFRAGTDGLIALTADRQSGASALVDLADDKLDRFFARVISDPATSRAYLGLPQVPPQATVLEEALMRIAADHALMRQDFQTYLPPLPALLTKLETSVSQVAIDQALMCNELLDMKAERLLRRGPPFSAASEAYCQSLIKRNGEGDPEVPYLRHRTKIFLQIIGDKPVTQYSIVDLQDFVDEVSWLPPNISKMDADYSPEKALTYIRENKRMRGKRLARNTLMTNYLGKVKTILKYGCDSVGVPFPLASAKMRVPKSVSPTQAKLIPDYDALTRIFQAGIASGNFVNTFLPLFGFITGRRIGLLTFLRRENIKRYHDVWIIIPPTVVLENGQYIHVPYKTEESLTYFVLHEIFDDLVEQLLTTGDGYFFEELHAKIKDPADAAQKRMGRLFDAASVDRKIYKAFHGLRHAKINEDREIKLDPRTTRLQVGHEARDIHDGYGSPGLRRSELHSIARAELPECIDWSMFKGLDWEALMKHRITRGRPRKAK